MALITSDCGEMQVGAGDGRLSHFLRVALSQLYSNITVLATDSGNGRTTHHATYPAKRAGTSLCARKIIPQQAGPFSVARLKLDLPFHTRPRSQRSASPLIPPATSRVVGRVPCLLGRRGPVEELPPIHTRVQHSASVHETVQDMFITPLYQHHASHTLASRAYGPQPHMRSSSATGPCICTVHDRGGLG